MPGPTKVVEPIPHSNGEQPPLPQKSLQRPGRSHDYPMFFNLSSHFGFGGRVDPCGCWLFWGFGRAFDEAVWGGGKSLGERELAGLINGFGLAVMNLVWRHQADA